MHSITVFILHELHFHSLSLSHSPFLFHGHPPFPFPIAFAHKPKLHLPSKATAAIHPTCKYRGKIDLSYPTSNTPLQVQHTLPNASKSTQLTQLLYTNRTASAFASHAQQIASHVGLMEEDIVYSPTSRHLPLLYAERMLKLNSSPLWHPSHSLPRR